MVTFANLTSGGSGDDLPSYPTASVSPAANRLVLIAIHGFITGTSPPPTPTVTGNGITYTLVRSQDVDASGGDRAMVFVFRGTSAAPSTGAISISFGVSMESVAWTVDQSSADVDTSGVNGAGAVVQSGGVTSAGNVSSLSVPFPVTMTAGNAGYSAFAHQAAELATPRVGWAELGDASASFAAIETQYIDGVDTAGSVTWAGSARSGGVVVEVKADVSTPGVIEPSGIPSAEAFGDPFISGGAVNLPGHISDTGTGLPVEPEATAHHPAWIDANGAMYKVMESEPGINPVMMKSTDGGATWAEAGVATHPDDMDDVEGAWSSQVGTTIWVAQTPDGDGDVTLKPFFTSDHATTPDTWGASENVDFDSGAGSGPAQWVSFAFLSDGSAWFFYQNAAYRKRNSGGTYGSRVATSVGQYPMPAVGAGNVTHLFVTTTTEVQYRTLTAAGVLSGTTRVDTTGHYGGSTAYGNCSNAVWFDNAGIDTACALYTEADGSLWLALVEDGVLSREQVTATAVGIDQDTATGGGPDCHLALDGTTLHAVYSEDASGDLNYRTRTADGVWSDETLLRAGGGTTFAWYPYNNVLTRPGGAKVMGVTYDVGPHANSVSFVEYDEVEIAAALVVEPTGIASAEAFGSATVSTGAVQVAPAGIPSAEAFGSVTVIPGAVLVVPTGIASAEAFGAVVVSVGRVELAPSGIPTAEAFGTATVSTAILPVGAPPPVGFAWLEHWADEFSGAAPAPEWGVYGSTGGALYGNPPREQRYQPGNVVVSGGTAKFIAQQVDPATNAGERFKSGALGTRETYGGSPATFFPREGYYEARMKVPHGQGLWPAFWLRHVNGSGVAEPDIMESFHTPAPGRTKSALHIEGDINVVNTNTFFEDVTATPGWHVWGLSIHESGSNVVFRWYLDGALIRSHNQPKGAWWTGQDATPDAVWDIALTFQIGGGNTCHPEDSLGYSRYNDTCVLGGTKPNSCNITANGQTVRRAGIGEASPTDETWEVDYVRVWTLTESAGPVASVSAPTALTSYQSTANTTAGQQAIGAAVAVGDTVIVTAHAGAAGVTLGISDSQGNTWQSSTAASAATGAANTTRIFWTKVTNALGAADTITVTRDTTGGLTWLAAKVTGASGALGNGGTTATGSGDGNDVSVTTTLDAPDGSLAVLAETHRNDATASAGALFTVAQQGASSGGGNPRAGASLYRRISPADPAVAPTATTSLSGAWSAAAIILEAEVAAQDIAPTGIASGEAFGTPSVDPGPVTIAPTGIPSAEAFGIGSVVVGDIVISPTGVTSLEAFGTPTVSGGVVLDKVDISFEVGPTRQGIAVHATSADTVEVAEARTSDTVVVAETRHGGLDAGATRASTVDIGTVRRGVDIGPARKSTVTIGETRRDRGE